jgi:hypothetical protein
MLTVKVLLQLILQIKKFANNTEKFIRHSDWSNINECGSRIGHCRCHIDIFVSLSFGCY